ncbi:MAG: Wzz/FepE/Etk N-terminal domain-containing protein [Bryobacteraceae bacterium]|nr:Wzz/FepE/Etk N-terminal domain-containing protein [Bryobacteraceae bacterium]
MQPAVQDPMNVPRRALDVEDYIDILRRHRGWILGPMLACIVIGVVAAFLWPNTYVSTATVRVIPPQVPERFVSPNVNQEVSQRINSMYQSITSVQSLTNIINVYQLYPRDRKRLPMQDVVEQMRKDISIQFLGQGQGQQRQLQAFSISYAYENRLVAQKVVQELVSRFIDENIRTRANQSVMTTDFLRDQYEQRKRDLEAIEQKLTKFRQENQGRMPEERMNNLQAINMIENRLANLNSTISRANQDKLLLESRLASLRDQLKLASIPESAQKMETAKNDRLALIERDIMTAETRLEALKQSYKDTHPDVRTLTQNIGVLKRTRDRMIAEEATQKMQSERASMSETKGAAPVALPREARGMETEIATITGQIEARNLEIDNARKEIESADRSMRQYQARLEATPTGTGQYEELLRERTLAQTRYEEMQSKMSQSQAATELENRKQGETLELLDAASLPMSPTQPKRPLIIGGAAGAGLALGLFLAAARELKDTTLKNLKDVRAYTQLMILGSVPLLEHDLVVRRRRRLGVLAWTTACLAGAAIMAGSVFFYYVNNT